MPFSARPHIEDRQMVQWMGEAIHLSGQTNFDLGGFNSYIYDSYVDFLNGVSGSTFLSLPLSAATDPVSGWSNHTVYSPGIVRIIPPKKVYFSGNTNTITATTQENVTNYILTSIDSVGTVYWQPISAITSNSGSCTPNLYVQTITPCGTDTITIDGNLLVKGVTTSGVTIIETEIIRAEDNNIELNYGGDHASALGGGITVLSGASNTTTAYGFTDSTIKTSSNGTWEFNTGLDVGYGNAPFTVPHNSLGVGEGNKVGDVYGAVIGRDNELNKGPHSVVLGGRFNYLRQSIDTGIEGGTGVILGGSGHTLEASTVFNGGTFVTWTHPTPNYGMGNSIVGGFRHEMYANTLSSIMGGSNHYMFTSLGSSIIGGTGHTLDTVDRSVILGGKVNSVIETTDSGIFVGYGNIIRKGDGNTVSPLGSAIIGGSDNLITAESGATNSFFSGSWSVIAGGSRNTISGHSNSFIGGGFDNTIGLSTGGNVIIGGDSNYVGSAIAGIFVGERNRIEKFSDGSAVVGGSDNDILSSSNQSVIVGGKFNIINGIDNSIILGGQNITATTNDTVYVPYLNIGDVYSGESVSLLAITSGGTVIQGGSLGSLCEACNFDLSESGATVTEGVTDVKLDPTEGDAIVVCEKWCCTEWTVTTYNRCTRLKSEQVFTVFADIKTYLDTPCITSSKIRCTGSESSGNNHGGIKWQKDILNEARPVYDQEPAPLAVDYKEFTASNTEKVNLENTYNVEVKDSSNIRIEDSVLITKSATTMSSTQNVINYNVYDSSFVRAEAVADSYVTRSDFIIMGAVKESTAKDSYFSSIQSSENVTLDGTEYSAIIAAKDVTATQDYTLYTTTLYVDDKFGLNANSLTVSAPINSGCTFVVTSGGTVGVKTCNPDFDLEVNGTFGATSKSFVIPHPLKEGKKLVHGAIEGPEFGVYDRGRFFGGVIELPDYWVNLVDENTITVQLTGEGFFMSPYVKEIKDNKVFVGNRFPFLKPNGFYTVYGERKDIDKINLEIDA